MSILRTTPLTPEDLEQVRRARDKAHILYEGKVTPHRSCGVCLAETFGLAWSPYQALRRGGITGEGTCGAIRAGEMVLGELLGPSEPTGPVDEAFREALRFYQSRWKEIQASQGWSDTVCNTLTRPLGEFQGEARAGFCTSMAADAAGIVAETLVRLGKPFEIVPFQPDPAE